MSFEWQNIDQAATTLEVDLPTLRKWIDEGQAPSRQQNGVMQVLIEFPDEEEAEAKSNEKSAGPANAQGGADANSTTNDDHIIEGEFEESRGSNEDSHGVENPTYAIQQTHQREMQLAGGMVAAWKQLAETADKELARSRSVSTIGWSVVAMLAMVIVISWWNLGEDINEANKQAASANERAVVAESDLANTKSNNETQATEIIKLAIAVENAQKKIIGEQQQVNETQKKLTNSTIEINRLADQLKSNKQLTSTQTELYNKTQNTLQDTITEERRRGAALEKKLDASNATAMSLQKELGNLKKQLAEIVAKVNVKKPSK